MEILPAEYCFGLCERGLQETRVTNAIATTVEGDLFEMRLDNIVQCEELRHGTYSDSFLKALA
jgi:hypothetical protein